MPRYPGWYYGSGQRTRSSDGYGSGSSGYGPRRSSHDHYKRGSLRSSRGGGTQGRGLMVSPWEKGVVPRSGGGGRQLQSTPDIVSSITQLSRMDNPESELALNILNAVLSTKEDSDWGGGGQRAWGRGHSQKRRMDWDNEYGYGPGGGPTGDGILPTPLAPPRKFPRREPSYGPAYSWAVVENFNAWHIRGLGGSGAGSKAKKTVTAKKEKPKALATTGKTDASAADKPAKPTPKAAAEGTNKTDKTEGATTAKEGVAADATTKTVVVKTEPEEGGAAGGTAAGSETGKATEEKAAAEGTAKAKTGVVKKVPTRKEEYPSVPLTYLRCHICHMPKFNSGSNFMHHVRSKKHHLMSIYYQEKIESTLKLLRAQSWLKSQRHIVRVMKQEGKITRCDVCECPIKGGRGLHIKSREHILLYLSNKCFICKIKFGLRGELEAHKLTYGHMRNLHTQDTVSKERFKRWAKRIEEETVIPEQKLTEEFHETVTQMQMNNLNRQVWNKDTIPVYDPAQPTGLNHLVKQSLYVCSVCPRKVSQTAHEALEHTKTKEHYDCYLEYLKALEKEEAADKEKETVVKKEDAKEQAIVNTKENKKTKTKPEEEEDTGMDMENMQVIDEDNDQEGNGEGVDEGGSDGEIEQGSIEEIDQEGDELNLVLEGSDEKLEEEGEEEVEVLEDEQVDLLQEVGEDVVVVEEEEEEEEPPPPEDKKEEEEKIEEKEEKVEAQAEYTGDKTTKSSSVPATPETKSSHQDPQAPAPAPTPAHMPKPSPRAPAKPPISSPQTRRGRGRGVGGAGARRSM